MWDDIQKPSSKQIFEFYIEAFVFFIFLLSLAVYNSYVRLPTQTPNTLSLTATTKFFQQPLPSRCLEGLQPPLGAAASSSSALSFSQTGSRSFPYSPSTSEHCLSQSKLKCVIGIPVRLQTQFPKPTRAIFKVIIEQCLKAKNEKDPLITLQESPLAATQMFFFILQRINNKDTTLFQNFTKKNPMTNKNLISLVDETTQKLTDCSLNAKEEIKILYPVMAHTFDYFDVNDSLFSFEKQYALLNQQIMCARFLLAFDFQNSDSFLNLTRQFLKPPQNLKRHNLEVLPYSISNVFKVYHQPFSRIIPAQHNWSQEWKHAWKHTFKEIKKNTSDELGKVKEMGLGLDFNENQSNVYCNTAKVCSLSHYYLTKKTAEAFRIYCSAWSGGPDRAILANEVLPQVTALYKTDSLANFFDREYQEYYNAISFSFLIKKPSNSFEKLCNENRGHRRPIFSAENANSYPYPHPYPELGFLKDYELFQLAIPIPSIPSCPQNLIQDGYLGL